MRDFASKISNKLQSSDYRGLYSKDGVIDLMKGYGCPQKYLSEITNDNWEEVYDILTDF